MLLEHYHELCNTNNPSSTFVSLPPIPNIESFSQSTISSLDSGSFDKNRADGNNQQPTKLEVANIKTVMAGNEEIYTPPPQDISMCLQRLTYRLNHHMIQLNINVHGTGRKEFVLIFYLLGKVQTHRVEHCPLN